MISADEVRAALGADVVSQDVALGPLTTMRVGGKADLVVAPQTGAHVVTTLRVARQASAPVFVLGAGSNLVVADAGYRGIVLTLGAMTGTSIEPESTSDDRGATVEIAAGTRNAHAVRAIHKAGFVGAEFLALVPGQFGGAVAMNAGTRWGELSQILVSAQVATAQGEEEVSVAGLNPSYRHGGVPPGAVVVSGRIRVVAGDVAQAMVRVKDEKAYRERTQPYRAPCAGSTFANPPGDAAGRLIEAAGLRGFRWGGAEFSSKHANFIVNWNHATAAQIVELMALGRHIVRERFGITLRPEVRLCGFDLGAGDVGSFLDRLEIPKPLRRAASAGGTR